MKVYPAIDLAGGRVVRLWKGRFDRETVYDQDPCAQARRFRAAGARRLHVVDLDGARDGEARQSALVARLAALGLPLQMGGGVRGPQDVERLLAAGVEAVVVGSLAVRQPQATRDLLERFGGQRIVLALDCRIDAGGVPRLLTDGWTRTASLRVEEVLERNLSAGLGRVLCTDVERDGTLEGPNVALVESLVARFPEVEVLASGGVRDARHLASLADTGCAGVIVGRALYEGTLELEQALGFEEAGLGAPEGAKGDAAC